jgi:hypothetical protein
MRNIVNLNDDDGYWVIINLNKEEEDKGDKEEKFILKRKWI